MSCCCVRCCTSVRQALCKSTRIGLQSFVDQLLAYGKNTDPLFYAMKFVDGLRDDIRSAVHMQRPASVDAGAVLALLQEELVNPSRRRDGKRAEPFHYAKFPPKGAQPLPPPPDREGRIPVGAPGVEDRRPRGVDAQLATLRNYRRDRGLCVRCGEKWSRDHHCPEQIQANVLQEVWDVCHCEDFGDCA